VMILMMPFWKVKVIRNLKKGYKISRTVLFCNHLSSLDPWLVNKITIFSNSVFIFKSSLYKIPIAGQGLYLSANIPIYFTSEKGGWGVKPGSINDVMKKAKELNDKNMSLLIYPEGTRSMNGNLQMFRPGFFRYAIENNVEILPCALHATNKLWPLKTMLVNPGTIYFSFGEPFYPTPGMSVDELKEKTRNMVFNLIKEFPDYDPKYDRLAKAPVAARGHGI
ncbi:1-acyl-sn-glycerol-3-phosphate acyltransferase, putative, partial [Hepatocystis sp. ex Piliocolobus tephrosceles]